MVSVSSSFSPFVYLIIFHFLCHTDEHQKLRNIDTDVLCFILIYLVNKHHVLFKTFNAAFGKYFFLGTWIHIGKSESVRLLELLQVA